MALLLRAMGTLLLVGGVLILVVGVRRLPEALPGGTPAQIVHIVDYQEERPRATYLHVLDGSLLPFGSVGIAPTTDPNRNPDYFLIPMVDEDHPLKREMERYARAMQDGDSAATTRWDSYVRSPPDWSEVQLLALSTATTTWSTETAISVETHAIEGVVRRADVALAPSVLVLLEDHAEGFAPEQVGVLYIGEVPPEREAMTVTIGLGGLASLLGLATFLATFWARRPGWLH